ncbi:hypothetical protein [Halogeometricum limi]|uniref:CARDB protein n=1 Tax=Halogeometricum limi TaxID=555875 RepID=A0A1I6HBV9_9EURY|nr:hypothetical protein [Halogeometricum limi]SFR51874.1 hypothetical protein SAMN04488124_2025 [Halogeometricum limi]
MSSRRDVLSSSGAVLALLAGCLGGPPTDLAASQTETRTPTNTEASATPTTTEVEADVRLRDVTVTPSLAAPNSPDSIGTYGDAEEQYVVVEVGTRGPLPLNAAEFAVAVDETTFGPRSVRDLTGYGWLWGFDGAYERGSGGTLVFPLPKPLDADTTTLRWPGDEHRLSDDAVVRLSRPPTAFSVTEFSAPETVVNGQQMTLTVTVENTGDADGTFVGALNRTGPEVAYAPVEAVSLDVAAGESTTWTHSFTPSTSVPDDGRSFDFVMHWRDGETVRTRTEVVESE